MKHLVGLRWLSEAWPRFRPADVADILVISVLAYATIVWFRKARSRFVVAGLAALVGLYLAAQLFEMYLTLALFRLVLGVALIALVVIFQEELRGAFERIVSARPFRTGTIEGRDELVDTVTRAVSSMAASKTGALIVFKGTAPLERHIAGGIALAAKPSEPLLFSIFDAHSPGHDGAVVIDGGRIAEFSAHLPLAPNPTTYHLGTRHCAAIGLSECSDSLVVVVSEERGTIAVSEGGNLDFVSPGELDRRLHRFLDRTFPRQRRSLWKPALTQNIGTKVLAVLLAVVAWLLTAREETEVVARTFEVPVQYQDVQPGLAFNEPQPPEVRVTLQGSAREFKTIDPASLSVSINAKNLGPGRHSIELSPENVVRPDDVTVQKLLPARIRVLVQPAPKQESNEGP